MPVHEVRGCWYFVTNFQSNVPFLLCLVVVFFDEIFLSAIHRQPTSGALFQYLRNNNSATVLRVSAVRCGKMKQRFYTNEKVAFFANNKTKQARREASEGMGFIRVSLASRARESEVLFRATPLGSVV